jgi:putative MATE family efflux protein
MQARKGDFSQGRVSGIIVKLGLPIMLAELVHVLYSFVDRMYIGHMAQGGTLALTGLGVCFPLITLIGAFANLCSTGGATLSTIARGEGDEKKAETIMGTAFTVLLIIGGALTVILFLIAPWALGLLGGDEQTLPMALGYFRIYVLGTVPVLISLGMNPFINAQGFPRVGMLTVIIGAALNIALDPLFIFTLNLGIQGAAIATVLSQTVSALWALRFLTGDKPPLRLKKLCVDGVQLLCIVKLGVTGFTFKVTNSVTQAIVNIMLKAWGGPVSALYVGAMSLINSLREIMSLPVGGLTTAGQNVMSFNFGAKLYRRVSDSIRFTFLCGLIVNLLMWALILFVPEPVIRIFSSDGELIRLTVHCARIYFGASPLWRCRWRGSPPSWPSYTPSTPCFSPCCGKSGWWLP